LPYLVTQDSWTEWLKKDFLKVERPRATARPGRYGGNALRNAKGGSAMVRKRARFASSQTPGKF